MSEPRLFDVRDGLTPEVLEDLRRARRVSLAVKDPRTAALGYWVEVTNPDGQPVEELRIALLRCEGVGGAQLPGQPAGGLQGIGLVFPHTSASQSFPAGTGRAPQGAVQFIRRPLPPLSGVLLDIADARRDTFWGRVLGLLRAGDIVRVGRDWSSGALPALRIGDGNRTFAWLRLPRRRLPAAERPAA